VNCIAISPDGHIAIICDARGWVFFWCIDNLEIKDPLAIYVAYYPVKAVYWQDKTHVILADNGGPQNYPYFYHLNEAFRNSDKQSRSELKLFPKLIPKLTPRCPGIW
jgi:hypothetical protein